MLHHHLSIAVQDLTKVLCCTIPSYDSFNNLPLHCPLPSLPFLSPLFPTLVSLSLRPLSFLSFHLSPLLTPTDLDRDIERNPALLDQYLNRGDNGRSPSSYADDEPEGPPSAYRKGGGGGGGGGGSFSQSYSQVTVRLPDGVSQLCVDNSV